MLYVTVFVSIVSLIIIQKIPLRLSIRDFDSLYMIKLNGTNYQIRYKFGIKVKGAFSSLN